MCCLADACTGLFQEYSLVNPEAYHDAERDGKLLEGDQGTTNLTVLPVSKCQA